METGEAEEGKAGDVEAGEVETGEVVEEEEGEAGEAGEGKVGGRRQSLAEGENDAGRERLGPQTEEGEILVFKDVANS